MLIFSLKQVNICRPVDKWISIDFGKTAERPTVFKVVAVDIQIITKNRTKVGTTTIAKSSIKKK